jgi:hypothetical protein
MIMVSMKKGKKESESLRPERRTRLETESKERRRQSEGKSFQSLEAVLLLSRIEQNSSPHPSNEMMVKKKQNRNHSLLVNLNNFELERRKEETLGSREEE